MKTSRLILLLTVLVLAAAALTLPRRAGAQPAPTPPPPSADVKMTGQPLPPVDGPRLLYGETQPDGFTTTLYLADPAAPDQPTPLAEITHRTGYPPKGSLSPDGHQAALLVIPPAANETSARTDGGEIWMLSADGASAQRLTGGVGALAGWSLDGSWLAYARLAAIPNPAHPEVPFRTELYRLSPDRQQNQLFFTDSDAYGVNPLGWLADGSYLVALLGLDGNWSLSALDAAAGQTLRAWDLPDFDLIRRLALAPTGDRMLVQALQDGQERLELFDLNSGQLQSNPSLAAAPFTTGQKVTLVQAVFSAQGNLWIYEQPRANFPARSSITGTGAQPQLPALDLAEGEYLLIESWSPDENWFFYRRYPHNYDSAYLQARGSSQLVALPSHRPGNWLTLFGWVMP